MPASRSVCPRCRRTYSAGTAACLIDGTPLVDEGRLEAAGGPREDDPGERAPTASFGRSPMAQGLPTLAPTGTTMKNIVVPPPRSGERPPLPALPARPAPRPTRAATAPIGMPIPSAASRSVEGGARPAELERLGPYRLLRQLGEGGMARIFLAEHVKLGRVCAIKRLHSDHFQDRLTVARFLAEARAVGAIHHPNLVSAYDVVEEPREIYLVMEYLDGRDVSQVLRDEGPMAPERAAEIGAQACDGLAAVHAHNIIHRDLKPENIFITRRPEGGEHVKLLDFGVARLLGDRPQELKTRSGLTVGTPTYMSPEQATASEIDARSDLYTIGVVLYEMLTGAPPFAGAGYGDVMLMHVNDPPERISSRRPDLPQWMEDVVMRCLEKDPAARFASAAELGAVLRAQVRPRAPVSSRPRETLRVSRVSIAPRSRQVMAAAAITGAVVLVAAAVGLTLRGRHAPGPAAPRAVAAAATVAPLAPPPVAPADLPAVATAAQPPPTVAPSPPAAAIALRRVHVDVTPAGASVLVAGERRCEAPCEVELVAAEGQLVLDVVARGYLAERRTIDGMHPPSEIRLVLSPAALPAPTKSTDPSRHRGGGHHSGSRSGGSAKPQAESPAPMVIPARGGTVDPFH